LDFHLALFHFFATWTSISQFVDMEFQLDKVMPQKYFFFKKYSYFYPSFCLYDEFTGIKNAIVAYD